MQTLRGLDFATGRGYRNLTGMVAGFVGRKLWILTGTGYAFTVAGHGGAAAEIGFGT